MAHEKTITVPFKTIEGTIWVVLPSVRGKKIYTEDEARDAWLTGKMEAFGVFDSLTKANYYARKRSETGSTEKGIDPDLLKKYSEYLFQRYGMFGDTNSLQKQIKEYSRQENLETAPKKYWEADQLRELGLFEPKMPVIEGKNSPLYDKNDPAFLNKILRNKQFEKDPRTNFGSFDYQNPFPYEF